MFVLSIAIAAMIGFVLAYHTYGRWLARKLFALNPEAQVPSVEFQDGKDYVPTAKSIVFGHHFTSIAGTGPIVGPAIAIMWGWVPALLWVLVGSIFVGAVHDFGALVVSLRNRGQTIGDVAGRLIHPRVRFLFLIILLFSLWIVLAIFGLVIAKVLALFPASVLPVMLQIPIAIVIGIWLRRTGAGLLVPSVFALLFMYVTVWIGAGCPGWAGAAGGIGDAIGQFNQWASGWPIWVWTIVLLIYCFVASVLPVWMLLQPRDYINSLQLITTLVLVLIGLIVAGFYGVEGKSLEMVAPAIEWKPENAPPIFPFLFVTIACGAISGFHCLVSSGTTSKQLKCEGDAQFVAYGSMLTEGFLAVIVILAVGAGIGLGWNQGDYAELSGGALWSSIYRDWNLANGDLGIKIGAFVAGAANFLKAFGLNESMAVAAMGVLVASFAGTTLDTATRLQRYVIQELAGAVETSMPWIAPAARPFKGAYVATFAAVFSAVLLAVCPRAGNPWSWETLGTGAANLWPMFGATNQLLGGLAFLVICFWLVRRNKPIWFVVAPALFMLVVPAWAMLSQVMGWWERGSYVLLFIALVTLALEIWMVWEASRMWTKAKGVIEEPFPDVSATSTEGGRSC